MYTYTHTHTHTYIYIYIYTQKYRCIHTYRYIHTKTDKLNIYRYISTKLRDAETYTQLYERDIHIMNMKHAHKHTHFTVHSPCIFHIIYKKSFKRLIIKHFARMKNTVMSENSVHIFEYIIYIIYCTPIHKLTHNIKIHFLQNTSNS